MSVERIQNRDLEPGNVTEFGTLESVEEASDGRVRLGFTDGTWSYVSPSEETVVFF